MPETKRKSEVVRELLEKTVTKLEKELDRKEGMNPERVMALTGLMELLLKHS